MAPEGTDAEVRALQAALAEVEEVFRLEQRGLEETHETLLRVQQERSSWQQRVGELQRLLQQQEAALDADAQQAKWKAAVCAAEQQRLNELNEKVRELRERLAKQPQAHQVVEEAVAKVECDTQQRRHSQQLQWEAKQQEMNQKLEAAEARLAFLEEQKAQCLKELLKWRRRMALLRIGRAGSSWKLQRRNELEQQQLDFQLLRLRKRLSRKQGHLDEEVALKAMGLKKELDKEAASNDLRQEERQEELEQLEEEVDALKERTAKAKELLRYLSCTLGVAANSSAFGGLCHQRVASGKAREKTRLRGLHWPTITTPGPAEGGGGGYPKVHPAFAKRAERPANTSRAATPFPIISFLKIKLSK